MSFNSCPHQGACVEKRTNVFQQGIRRRAPKRPLPAYRRFSSLRRSFLRQATTERNRTPETIRTGRLQTAFLQREECWYARSFLYERAGIARALTPRQAPGKRARPQAYGRPEIHTRKGDKHDQNQCCNSYGGPACPARRSAKDRHGVLRMSTGEGVPCGAFPRTFKRL